MVPFNGSLSSGHSRANRRDNYIITEEVVTFMVVIEHDTFTSAVIILQYESPGTETVVATRSVHTQLLTATVIHFTFINILVHVCEKGTDRAISGCL